MKNPKQALAENAAKAREMHLLYPFTRTVSSAALRTTNHQRRAMRIHSSHVVSIDVEIPEGAFVSSRDNPFDRKNSLIIKAKSDVSVEDAKEILLEVVRVIVDAIPGADLMVVS